MASGDKKDYQSKNFLKKYKFFGDNDKILSLTNNNGKDWFVVMEKNRELKEVTVVFSAPAVSLKQVLQKCTTYANHEEYVFDTIEEGNKIWFVILQKLVDTVDAFEQDIYDQNFATFYANKLKVIEIFDIDDSNVTKENKLNYSVGRIVSSVDGVRYFTSPIRAYYQSNLCSNDMVKWHENGRMAHESHYVYIEGKLVERRIEWTENGRMKTNENLNTEKDETRDTISLKSKKEKEAQNACCVIL